MRNIKNEDEDSQLQYHIYRRFEVQGLVGKGTYAQVFKVISKKTRMIFALKKILNAYQNITDAKRTYRQLYILSQLKHPCIVKFEGTITFDPVAYATDSTRRNLNLQRTSSRDRDLSKVSKHVYALFQFIEFDLEKVLRNTVQNLLPQQRKYIAFQLIHAVNYIHSCGIVHRDIKPSNILIDGQCNIKLCDFGLCRLAARNQTDSSCAVLTQYVASRMYRAPQVLLGLQGCSKSIDIWGIGCVIAQLCTRESIFSGQGIIGQLQSIFKLIGIPTKQQINAIRSQKAKQLLKTICMHKNKSIVTLRDKIYEAEDDQMDLILRMLHFDPQKRINPNQALRHPYFHQIISMGISIPIITNSLPIQDPLIKQNKPSLDLIQHFVDSCAKPDTTRKSQPTQIPKTPIHHQFQTTPLLISHRSPQFTSNTNLLKSHQNTSLKSHQNTSLKSHQNTSLKSQTAPKITRNHNHNHNTRQLSQTKSNPKPVIIFKKQSIKQLIPNTNHQKQLNKPILSKSKPKKCSTHSSTHTQSKNIPKSSFYSQKSQKSLSHKKISSVKDSSISKILSQKVHYPNIKINKDNSNNNNNLISKGLKKVSKKHKKSGKSELL